MSADSGHGLYRWKAEGLAAIQALPVKGNDTEGLASIGCLVRLIAAKKTAKVPRETSLNIPDEYSAARLSVDLLIDKEFGKP